MLKFSAVFLAIGLVLAGLSGCGSSDDKSGTTGGTSTTGTTTAGDTTGGAQTPPTTDAFATDIAPMLSANCLPCHGGPEPKKGLDVTKFKTEADAKAAAEQVHEMVEVLENKKMPPAGGKPLSDEDRAKMVAGLKALG